MGATQYRVTRLLEITQEPPKDITPFLMPGISLPDIKVDQQFSQSTVMSMLERRALSAGFWKLFERLEVSDITRPLFGSIAPEVMSLLDRRDLQPGGLLDLLRVDDLFCLLSVCLNTVTGSLERVAESTSGQAQHTEYTSESQVAYATA
ncbi:uncharacterized protein FFB14_02235 [Fusarium fujikuroi]|nr:uncharacterized protein FFB14_02235 [Fusarium fujikuroi]